MIGGSNGQENAEKLIHNVIDSIMTPELLSEYTWTGRAKGNKRKNKFKTYTNIQKLTFNVFLLAQSTYCFSHFLKDLKEKVLKYAYLNEPTE